MLTLNDGQQYSLEIDGEDETETFCVFFARGSVEAAAYVLQHDDATLLDHEGDQRFGFREELTAATTVLGEAWERLARSAGSISGVDLSWEIERLGSILARHALNERVRSNKLGSTKVATRQEIWRRVRRAMDEIEADLANDWTLAELGRAACMAPHHFQRCFLQLRGETPRRYIARRRLERAQALLRSHGTMSVTEVCLAVGYTSLGSFSTSFAKQFGYPPSDRR
ncbi:MAG TPA: helix-turn-helix transcriptional regulator [Caulobacteraceae bacterium]